MLLAMALAWVRSGQFCSAVDEGSPLSGFWVMESFMVGETELVNQGFLLNLEFPDNAPNEYVMHFSGRQKGDKPKVFLYKLYEDKMPKQFDVWYIGTEDNRIEPTKEPTARGIYSIVGDIFTRCYVTGNRPRPVEFGSTGGRAVTVHRLLRKDSEMP